MYVLSICTKCVYIYIYASVILALLPHGLTKTPDKQTNTHVCPYTQPRGPAPCIGWVSGDI